MKFLEEDGRGKPYVVTNLGDMVTGQKEGEQLNPPYDFEDYKAKVNRSGKYAKYQ